MGGGHDRPHFLTCVASTPTPWNRRATSSRSLWARLPVTWTVPRPATPSRTASSGRPSRRRGRARRRLPPRSGRRRSGVSEASRAPVLISASRVRASSKASSSGSGSGAAISGSSTRAVSPPRACGVRRRPAAEVRRASLLLRSQNHKGHNEHKGNQWTELFVIVVSFVVYFFASNSASSFLKSSRSRIISSVSSRSLRASAWRVREW